MRAARSLVAVSARARVATRSFHASALAAGRAEDVKFVTALMGSGLPKDVQARVFALVKQATVGDAPGADANNGEDGMG